MATLVVITHEFDTFLTKDKGGSLTSAYLLYDVLLHLERMGHTIRIVRGPIPGVGDAALYHVDATIPAQEYLDLERHYARTINFRTGDISKREISGLILARDDPWGGPVIVKCNYNNRAIIEDLHNRRAARMGLPLPHPGVTRGDEYRVLEALSEVTDRIWSDPSLVVEKFVPEPDEEGFALRTWVFMGSRERCTRVVTADRISKAADVLKYEPVEVPPQLRAERERLGFDFGKFDFVMHDGEPVLFDANRTPGVAAAIRPMLEKGAANLAEGLHELITGESVA
jgi:hypothetical protein